MRHTVGAASIPREKSVAASNSHPSGLLDPRVKKRTSGSTRLSLGFPNLEKRKFFEAIFPRDRFKKSTSEVIAALLVRDI